MTFPEIDELHCNCIRSIYQCTDVCKVRVTVHSSPVSMLRNCVAHDLSIPIQVLQLAIIDPECRSMRQKFSLPLLVTRTYCTINFPLYAGYFRFAGSEFSFLRGGGAPIAQVIVSYNSTFTQENRRLFPATEYELTTPSLCKLSNSYPTD